MLSFIVFEIIAQAYLVATFYSLKDKLKNFINPKILNQQADSLLNRYPNFYTLPFEKLILNTKNDGTPNLLESVEKKLNFQILNLNVGDIAIFSNTTPHRSKKNNSSINRRILYYTYTPEKFGNNYEKYYFDKKNSKNKTSKSLSGEI